MKPGQNKLKKKAAERCYKRKGYTEENLKKALNEISKGMSKKLAAKTFNVPRSTLQFRIKHPGLGTKPGPSTVLTEEEEQVFVNWIKVSSRKGFPKRKDDLIKSVSDFIKKSGKVSSFKNGEKWIKLFLARHPSVTYRIPEAVTAASSTVSEADVRGWFEQIRIYMTENNYYEILGDPSRVFNGDETNFVLCPKTGLVLSSKGERNVYEVDHAQAKTSLTVMFTFGADGQLTPPMVIFPYKRLPGEITSKIPEDWGVGLSDNGWMNSEVFFEYIKNILHPHLVKTGTKFPIVLFVDGHKSHLTYAVSDLCTSLGIILIALYPNCTRLLQPADVAAFKPLKTQWQKTVLEWRRTNPSQALTKTQFVPLLKDTIEKSVKSSTIINGFRATGLCPWDEEAVDYTKCLGTKPKSKLDPSQPNPVTNERVLTKYDFIKMLGESNLSRIDGGELTADQSNECLKNICHFFLGSQNDCQLQTSNENTNINNFDIENMEIILHNSPNESITEQNFEPVSENVIVIEEIFQPADEIDFMKDMSTKLLPIQQSFTPQPPSQSSPSKQAFDHLEFDEQVFIKQASTQQTSMPLALIPQVSNQQSCIQQTFSHQQAIKQPPTQQEVIQRSYICQPSTSRQQQTSTLQETPQKSIIKVIADVKIGADEKSRLQHKFPGLKKDNTPVKLQDILVVPKTPTRKGVKNTKKTPFVLTSAEWKAQENDKIRLKQEKAEGIKMRKEERERKKIEKEKKPLPKKNKINKTKDEAKDEVSRILFSEEFYKFDNRKADTIIENIDKETQKVNTLTSNARKNCTKAEIEKMLLDSDDSV